MEENILKALTIGFAIFIFIFTLSGIMIYYNTAVSQTRSLNYRAELVKETTDIVSNVDLTEIVASGNQLANLIRKYAGDDNVQIKITAPNILTSSNVNNSWKNSIDNISEQALSMINLSKEYRITKTITNDIISLWAIEQ